MITGQLYNLASATIERIHAEDSNTEIDKGKSYPAELLYSQRMLEMLTKVDPDSSYLLKIAIQCQHLKRWGVPRSNYPYDRRGYHQWRRVVMEFQIEQTKEILEKSEIDEEDRIFITEALRNQGNKSDPNAKIIMDTACLVFLKWYLEPFASKHENSKVADILKKTMRKMSDHGLQLIKSIELSPTVKEILKSIN